MVPPEPCRHLDVCAPPAMPKQKVLAPPRPVLNFEKHYYLPDYIFGFLWAFPLQSIYLSLPALNSAAVFLFFLPALPYALLVSLKSFTPTLPMASLPSNRFAVYTSPLSRADLKTVQECDNKPTFASKSDCLSSRKLHSFDPPPNQTPTERHERRP
ncbi:uncharacterized protein CLUP02_12583 [Colletotrichum lupini]|uniref:Uncharacterized protein n=1 Tax=Colletotrichum lupini TaxID=145971 RepID=A0A9Q8WKY3_9PEZI|nr:uncharacterized protein CLUP02_12583 [Colletotrichum lupini]UQC87081.1 hypothetical protein CLUP02_12583 [Colletotrichum lupini]